MSKNSFVAEVTFKNVSLNFLTTIWEHEVLFERTRTLAQLYL